MNESKLEQTKEKIYKWVQGKKPCLLCSFGKDSMCMLHVTRSIGLNLPVVYHRNHWMPEKNAFADSVIQLWKLEVFDWPPSECGIKVHDDCIQTVNIYNISPKHGMHMPNGILEPIEGEAWVCARYDILERPKGLIIHPWDLLLSGHKGGDSDIFEGLCRLKTDYYEHEDAPSTCFPLRDWNDDDVWDYLIENEVPIQESRYDIATRKERDDKRHNNDYVRACTRCVDRRQPNEVFCPKVERTIPNVSDRVKDMEQEFAYIE